jgi:hypothetical protein
MIIFASGLDSLHGLHALTSQRAISLCQDRSIPDLAFVDDILLFLHFILLIAYIQTTSSTGPSSGRLYSCC